MTQVNLPACSPTPYYLFNAECQAGIAVRDRMFLGMQDFEFAKSNHFCPNFALILPKSNQISPNLTNFSPQKKFDRGCGCIRGSYGTASRDFVKKHMLVTTVPVHDYSS